MTKRSIATITAEMKELIGDQDGERAHGKAVDLLVEALLTLDGLTLDGHVTKSLRAYFAKVKWR